MNNEIEMNRENEGSNEKKMSNEIGVSAFEWLLQTRCNILMLFVEYLLGAIDSADSLERLRSDVYAEIKEYADLLHAADEEYRVLAGTTKH